MSTLTITILQQDLVWEDKAANLRRFEEKIEAVPEKMELVVLPEMFSTGFSMRPEVLAEPINGPTIAWMRGLAARKRIILTGSVIVNEGGNYYNRLIWMQPNGQYGVYDKRHRFAYAGEDQHYTAGNKRLITSVKGWRVMPLVCYDLRFPVWSRQTPSFQEKDVHPEEAPGVPASEAMPLAPQEIDGTPTLTAEPEYDLLLYVANWPQRRSTAWKTLLQARAIENQTYVVGVNRIGNDGNNIYHSGDSMIIDPLGEILYHQADKEDVFTITLEKETLKDVRQRFPFWRDADRFSIEP